MFVGMGHAEVECVCFLMPREPLTRVVQALFQGFGPFPQDIPENLCLALVEVHIYKPRALAAAWKDSTTSLMRPSTSGKVSAWMATAASSTKDTSK